MRPPATAGRCAASDRRAAGGRRQVKTHLLNHAWVELARHNASADYPDSQHPEELESLLDVGPRPRWVVIDEIERVPALLAEVHRLIDQKRYRFLWTGSRARKLRRGSVDRLPGRACVARGRRGRPLPE